MENIFFISNVWSFQSKRNFCNKSFQLRMFIQMFWFYTLVFSLFCFKMHCVILLWLNNGLVTSQGMCTCCVTSQWPPNKKKQIQKKSEWKEMFSIFINKSVPSQVWGWLEKSRFLAYVSSQNIEIENGFAWDCWNWSYDLTVYLA